MASYAERHRHYHNINHIEQGLEHIRILYPGDRRSRDEVMVAYIFHDIVYIVGDCESEKKSAALCRQFLEELHVGPSVIARVTASIEDTAYEAHPRHEDARRVRDVDWLMFAAPPEMFAADCLAIQREVEPLVGAQVFVRGRLAFLEAVRRKAKTLYHDRRLQSLMTPHVLANIKAEMNRLKAMV